MCGQDIHSPCLPLPDCDCGRDFLPLIKAFGTGTHYLSCGIPQGADLPLVVHPLGERVT